MMTFTLKKIVVFLKYQVSFYMTRGLQFIGCYFIVKLQCYHSVIACNIFKRN